MTEANRSKEKRMMLAIRIHGPISLQKFRAINLIDFGATNNFINLFFMRKRGVKPNPFNTHRICKIEEGTTAVAYCFHPIVHLGEETIPLDFYMMNGKSNQGVVLSCGFLAKQEVLIDFGTKQATIKGKM